MLLSKTRCNDAGSPQYNCRENEWGVSTCEECEEWRVAGSQQYNRREDERGTRNVRKSARGVRVVRREVAGSLQYNCRENKWGSIDP